jgi:hypothetical protein
MLSLMEHFFFVRGRLFQVIFEDSWEYDSRKDIFLCLFQSFKILFLGIEVSLVQNTLINSRILNEQAIHMT